MAEKVNHAKSQTSATSNAAAKLAGATTKPQATTLQQPSATLTEQLLIRGATASAGGALFVVPFETASPELILGVDSSLKAGTATGSVEATSATGTAATASSATLATSLTAQEITITMGKFANQHGRLPTTIQAKHGCYALGNTYDETLRGEAIPSQVPKPSRANVVRNRIAIVTGGAQGIGEGLVRGLVAEGAFVWIADMNKAGADQLAEKLNTEAGVTVAKGVEVDVTNEASVSAMINQVVQTCGGFDLFVSNAGVLKAGSVKEMTLQDFQFVTSVDYTGFFICTKYAARALAIQNSSARLMAEKPLAGQQLASRQSGQTAYWSDIIGISSKSGLEGSKKNGAYAGAKFGTIGLTQSFALELVEDNIKVNSICPGNFLDGPLWSDPDRGLFVQYLSTGKVPGAKTIAEVRAFYEGKVPMGRGCQAEDLVRALLYTVEQTYETGQAIPVTGGQVMLN